jgi:hypothetical protein
LNEVWTCKKRPENWIWQVEIVDLPIKNGDSP